MQWLSTAVLRRLLLVPALIVALAANARAIHGEKKDPPKVTELEGKWVFVSVLQGGTLVKEIAGTKVVIEGERFKVLGEDANPDKLKFRLDPTKKPKHIDFIEPNVEQSLKGIYLIEGDTLKICVDRGGKDRPSARPTDFASKEGTEISLTILRRDKK
jgi:uncharacterized protein (TIGR03067 family)